MAVDREKVWGNPNVCKENGEQYALDCMYLHEKCPNADVCYNNIITGKGLCSRPTSGARSGLGPNDASGASRTTGGADTSTRRYRRSR